MQPVGLQPPGDAALILVAAAAVNRDHFACGSHSQLYFRENETIARVQVNVCLIVGLKAGQDHRQSIVARQNAGKGEPTRTPTC